MKLLKRLAIGGVSLALFCASSVLAGEDKPQSKRMLFPTPSAENHLEAPLYPTVFEVTKQWVEYETGEEKGYKIVGDRIESNIVKLAELKADLQFFEEIKRKARELYNEKDTNARLEYVRNVDYPGEIVSVFVRSPEPDLDYSIVTPRGESNNRFSLASLAFTEDGKNPPQIFSVSLRSSRLGSNFRVTFNDNLVVEYGVPGGDIIIKQEQGNHFTMKKRYHLKNPGNDVYELTPERKQKLLERHLELEQRRKKAEPQQQQQQPSSSPYQTAVKPISSVQITPSATSIVENTYTVSVLFLFDRELMNNVSYDTIRRDVIKGFEKARELMYARGNGMASPTSKWGIGTAYYKNYKGWNVMGYEPAPASLCTSITPCTYDYEGMIDRMAVNQEVYELKKKYNADLVMYVHDQRGVYGGSLIEGLATRPLSPTLPDYYALYQTGVYHYHNGIETFIHELFHLLGAGHSRDNNDAAPSHPSEAFIGYHWYFSSQYNQTVRHPYKTFMAYKETCDAKASIPQLECIPLDTLSHISDLYQHEDGNLYNIGGSFTDNYWAMYSMMPRSASWSHYYNKP